MTDMDAARVDGDSLEITAQWRTRVHLSSSEGVPWNTRKVPKRVQTTP